MNVSSKASNVYITYINGLRLISKHYRIPAVGLGLTLFIQLTDAFPYFVWLGVLVGIYQTIYTFALPKLLDLAETTGLTGNDILYIPLTILRRTWLQGILLFGVTMILVFSFVVFAKSTNVFLSDGAVLLLLIGISGCAACLAYTPVFVSLFEQSLLSGIRLSIKYAIRHKYMTGIFFVITVLAMIPAAFGITSRIWLIFQQIVIQFIAYVLTASAYIYITQNSDTRQSPTVPSNGKH